MTELKKNTVVILGAGGRVGTHLLKYLLENTGLSVIAAVRNPEKLKEKLREINFNGFEEKLSAITADASDKKSLMEVFRIAGFAVIVSSSQQFTPVIADACLESECDYIDIMEAYSVYRNLKYIEPEIIKKGRVFITQAGILPGLPSVLISYAAGKFKNITGAMVGTAAGLYDLTGPEMLYDYIDAIAGNKPQIYRSGMWRKASALLNRPPIDYGFNYGLVRGFPLNMPELLNLPEKFGIGEMGVYGASSNGLIDLLAVYLIKFLYFIREGLGKKILANMFYKMIRKMNSASRGYAISLNASYKHENEEKKYRLSLFHEDTYLWTAMAVFLLIKQYLKGYFNGKSGLYFTGDILNHEEFLNEMNKMGVMKEEVFEE